MDMQTKREATLSLTLDENTESATFSLLYTILSSAKKTSTRYYVYLDAKDSDEPHEGVLSSVEFLHENTVVCFYEPEASEDYSARVNLAVVERIRLFEILR